MGQIERAAGRLISTLFPKCGEEIGIGIGIGIGIDRESTKNYFGCEVSTAYSLGVLGLVEYGPYREP